MDFAMDLLCYESELIIMDRITEWLLDGPDWLKYAVELQLLDKQPDFALLQKDHSIGKVVDRLNGCEAGISTLNSGQVSYRKTGNAYWDLFLLADIGLTIQQLWLEEQVEKIFELQAEDGSFIFAEKPNYFCISAIILASIAKMGYADKPQVRKFVDCILDSQRLDGGWHCARSRAVGKKLEDTESCPMDNLNLLLLLANYDEYREDPRFNGAIDLLLEHWAKRQEKWRPYGFGIGKQFMQLKYPEVKYGILRVLDVLSVFPYAVKQASFQEMLEFVRQKSVDGKYYAESIAKAYADFDFGQKKEPSRWITFLIERIEQRALKLT